MGRNEPMLVDEESTSSDWAVVCTPPVMLFNGLAVAYNCDCGNVISPLSNALSSFTTAVRGMVRLFFTFLDEDLTG